MSNKEYVKKKRAKFESATSIAEIGHSVDFTKESCKESGITVISDGKQGMTLGNESHCSIISGTGDGKTRRTVLPYVINAIYAGDFLVINDCKSEIYKYTRASLKKHGYKIIVLDYRDLRKGNSFNLMEYIAQVYVSGEKGRAQEMFEAMFISIFHEVESDTDPLWHMQSAKMGAALASILCEMVPPEKVNFSNLMALFEDGREEWRRIHKNYLYTYIDEHKEQLGNFRTILAAVFDSALSTRQSYESVFRAGVSKLVRNMDLINQSSVSDFRLDDIIDDKVAIFIFSRDEDTVYNSMISLVVNQFYQNMVRIASMRPNNNDRLKRHVSFILDEFASLNITDFPEIISKCRSRNINFVLAYQSMEQLSAIYTESGAKTIISNCSVITYMYSSDISLLKMLSELSGTREDANGVEHPLLSVDELRKLDRKRGQTLFLIKGHDPFVTDLPDISGYDNVEYIDEIDLTLRDEKPYEVVNFKELIEDDYDKKHNLGKYAPPKSFDDEGGDDYENDDYGHEGREKNGSNSENADGTVSKVFVDKEIARLQSVKRKKNLVKKDSGEKDSNKRNRGEKDSNKRNRDEKDSNKRNCGEKDSNKRNRTEKDSNKKASDRKENDKKVSGKTNSGKKATRRKRPDGKNSDKSEEES